jgi:hypothetical protein
MADVRRCIWRVSIPQYVDSVDVVFDVAEPLGLWQSVKNVGIACWQNFKSLAELKLSCVLVRCRQSISRRSRFVQGSCRTIAAGFVEVESTGCRTSKVGRISVL